MQILAATSPTTGGDTGDFAIMANAISFAPQGGGNALAALAQCGVGERATRFRCNQVRVVRAGRGLAVDVLEREAPGREGRRSGEGGRQAGEGGQ